MQETQETRGLIPGSGRFPGEGHGNPLQYSCLGNHGQRGLVDYSPWGSKRVKQDLVTKQQPVTKLFSLSWRPGLNPWVKKISWRRKWQPTSVFLPGKSHGQRSLASHSPWGRKESDVNNTSFHFTTGQGSMALLTP